MTPISPHLLGHPAVTESVKERKDTAEQKNNASAGVDIAG